MTSIKVKISGMHCTGCAASVSKALMRVDGIKKADANFSTNSADIVYDEKKVNKEKIVKTIENLGYKAE